MINPEGKKNASGNNFEIAELSGKWATDICGRQIFLFYLYVMQKLFF